ncbi:MAG TPA: hypothetical protein VFS40_08820 [Gemmatimonadales bacterium]|nr:hypothetical protein [Gemmatimonadales bacterium]
MTNQHAQESSGDDAVVRQARLRADFARLYPTLAPDVWLPAAEVGAVVLFRRLLTDGRVMLGSRLLEESHFEFRGGWSRGDQAYQTRAGDVEESDWI